MFSGISRCQSPFAYWKSKKYDPKWADTLSVTFEPIELEKTATPRRNDQNDLRISNFSLKNQILLKWVGFSPIYSCPRPKLKKHAASASVTKSQKWAKSCLFMCFKEWGRWFCDIQPGLQCTYMLLLLQHCAVWVALARSFECFITILKWIEPKNLRQNKCNFFYPECKRKQEI